MINYHIQGITRLTGPIPANVDDNGDVKKAANRTPPETLIDEFCQVERSKGLDDDVDIRPTTVTSSPGSGSPRITPVASSAISPCSPTHPFVEVPFPLHPDKSFRIHTSPLVGTPVNSTDVQLKAPGLSGIVPPSSTLPTFMSCPFPSTSSSGARLSPKLSTALKNLKEFTSTLPHRFSLPFSHAAVVRSTGTLPRNSASDNDPELILSPNTQRRMYKPIDDNIYKSPPTPYSRTSSPKLSSPEGSPSSVNLLSSRVNWLRRSDKDQEDESHREVNYSTMCLPSSSPLHQRSSSTSPSPRLSPGRIRSGHSSPVAVSLFNYMFFSISKGLVARKSKPFSVHVNAVLNVFQTQETTSARIQN